MSKYGLTPELYRAWLEQQGGNCPGCSLTLELLGTRSTQPNVDHCHTTEAVRGILCNGCNTALGQFKEDPELLKAACRYLDLHAA